MFPLFLAPVVSNEAVPDDGLLAFVVKARVQVHGDVISSCQVHSEPMRWS